MKMVTIKKEFDSLIKQVSDEIERFNEKMYDFPDIDGYYSDLVEDLEKENKLTKKQRKELAAKLLKERYPKFCKLMEELDLLSEGMTERVKQSVEKFEDIEQELSELEDMKEELEQRKDDLSFWGVKNGRKRN